MARLLTCGFEMGTYDELNGTKGDPLLPPVVSGTYARTGNYGLVIRSMYTLIGHAFDANVSELYGRAAIYFDSEGITYDTDVLVFRDEDATELITIRYYSGRQALDITRGGVALATGSFALAAGRWYVMEFHVVINNSSGSVVVKINGVTHTSFTGDTAGSAVESVRSIVFGPPSAGANIGNFYCLDDIAINDTSGSYQNSWIGLGGIYFLKPNGEGATQDFTPSAGTVHYSLVDDVPANITDWVQGDTSAQLELFTVDDTPNYITTVDLVEVVCQAAVVESGSNDLRSVVRQGTVNYSGTPVTTVASITDSYVIVKGTPLYVQPNSSGAWGIAAVDSMEVGWEIP